MSVFTYTPTVSFFPNQTSRLSIGSLDLPISIKSIFSGSIKLRDLYTNELAWKISRRRWDEPRSGFLRPFLFYAKLQDRIKILSAKKRYRSLCENHKKLNSYILFAISSSLEKTVIAKVRVTYSSTKMRIFRESISTLGLTLNIVILCLNSSKL